MNKIDFKKELSELYRASSAKVEVVQVPPLRYLMIDGSGDPNTSADYAAAVEALFTVSYHAKFSLKKSPGGADFGVMPLEGLWWADDWSAFTAGDKSRWKWTMMIHQPALLPEEMVRRSIEHAAGTKKLAAARRLRLELFEEGKAAQVLHVGPFAAEGPTIERVHAFIDERGRPTGKHHEIYLSDIRRAAPEKWKTIIRQPFV